jgi:hypothetical protein
MRLYLSGRECAKSKKPSSLVLWWFNMLQCCPGIICNAQFTIILEIIEDFKAIHLG